MLEKQCFNRIEIEMSITATNKIHLIFHLVLVMTLNLHRMVQVIPRQFFFTFSSQIAD